ncbi:MAG TPA: hypothetical protein PKA00_12680 [Saprospiraceae bacterium]|nr:hypothetical protein [Saprospiraceae bacterium]HMQ83763.1 hypothetical protein [Saprospiraceae bacterium]
MKNHLFYPCFLLLSWLCCSCTTGASEEEKIAQEICTCMTPLAAAYTSMRDAMAAGDPEAITRAAEKLEVVGEQVEDCADHIDEKYGPFEEEEGGAIQSAVQEKCPDIINTINEAESNMVK